MGERKRQIGMKKRESLRKTDGDIKRYASTYQVGIAAGLK